MKVIAGGVLLAALLTACTGGDGSVRGMSTSPAPTAQERSMVSLPAVAAQGDLVVGRAPPGSAVAYGGRIVRVAVDGTFVIGIPRDAAGPLAVRITPSAGVDEALMIAVTPRDWPVERIHGVPPSTVDPPPAIAARIAAEQARVSQARTRDDPRLDFLQTFIRPVEGRVSGRFGSQRVYNGSVGAPHSGMDIAAPDGTPVRAPAGGVVTFADPGLYLTGGTVVLDHGHGVSSNFLHLSRIDVQVGARLSQGDVLGAVGATGRATGPHLHWGMNWFDVRIDPMRVLERGIARD